MDEKDLELLRILEENSRLSQEDIATMTNLTTGEVAARVQALEAARIIQGYSTVINWEKAGNDEVAAIIELKVSPERDFGYDRIAERLCRFRQVKTLRLITGTYDLQIIVTGKNMQDVSRFVSEHVAPMDRIRETATHIVMKTYKENGNAFFEQPEMERLPYSP
ncbi:MAG: AsnC family transcriptional regulator [Methanomicrobiales archaeon HGW-Methanomicrobiales-3]|jgi:DNA-binding Lrp family transcriptional regulator|nr:MAG: AsnC family transcriptional regulator [Methanomicrobiales archaeon HGW-Methanomicrobiales-3]